MRTKTELSRVLKDRPCTAPGGCDICPDRDYCRGLRITNRVTTEAEETPRVRSISEEGPA